MPGMCSVPGCKGYKKARSRGVVFHSLPTRDRGRCIKWLKAIQSPKFDENTPVGKYGNIRVCSQHFKPEDYEPDIQAELMKTTPRKILKSNVIPSVFSGRHREDLGSHLPVGDSSSAEMEVPSTAAQPSTSVVSGSGVDSVLRWAPVLTSISSGAPSPSSQSPPPAQPSENVCSVASVDPLNESLHQDTELSSTKSEKSTEKDLSQSKTIVNDSCLMELFKKCQMCGQTITKKKVSHCGAQKKVQWSCLGGHRGVWMSSPHLWEAFPEIHLLTALAILFSGGTFTYFKKWAKHLHLNFMGNKSFFEIQKAYLNSEENQMIRTEQDRICAKAVQQQLEVIPLHISDPLRKIKAKSSGREKGSLSSWSRGKHHQQDDVEHQSETIHMVTEVDWLQDSFEEMEVSIDEDEYDNAKNKMSDLDMKNLIKSAELRALGVDDSCDEEVYVPLIPQRSTTSELLLECEEEELEPWQKQTSQVHSKDEDDGGELTNNQIDCKSESSLQRNAVNTSPPKVKTETPQPVVFNNQGFIVASPQFTSNTDFIDSLRTRCPPRNSFAIIAAAPQQIIQKVTPTELQQNSNSSVSLSSVLGPAVYSASSNQLEFDQSSSRALSVPISLPCFTVLELESVGTSNKQLYPD